MRVDIKNGAHDDILQADCFLRIQELVNSGRCLGVWMAPQCSSWSTSRRNDGSAAVPLRSAEYIMGLPNLSPSDRRKVGDANNMMDRTVKIAINCILNRVPSALEIFTILMMD